MGYVINISYQAQNIYIGLPSNDIRISLLRRRLTLHNSKFTVENLGFSVIIIF